MRSYEKCDLNFLEMTLLDDKVIAIIVLFVSLAVLFIPREGGEVSGGRRGETDMPLLVSLKRGE